MFHIHLRPSRSVSVPPHQSKPLHTHSHTSEALLTHQSLQYPYQILHTHPSHPNKTLHTHIRPSLPIIGLHTITCPFKTTLGPPPHSQVLLTHLRPSYPTQTFLTTLCHPDQFQEPLHTHPNPFTPIRSRSYPPKPSISISGPLHPRKAF